MHSLVPFLTAIGKSSMSTGSGGISRHCSDLLVLPFLGLELDSWTCVMSGATCFF